MNKLIWKSEEEQQEELKKRISEWKEGFSKDGFIECAKGIFVYKKIEYSLIIHRYYNHTNRFCSMNSQNISDKIILIEPTDKSEELRKIVRLVDEYSDFLWHDTMHTWNETQTTEELIEGGHKLAKKDIDNFFNNNYEKILDKKIEELYILKNKLKKVVTNGK